MNEKRDVETAPVDGRVRLQTTKGTKMDETHYIHDCDGKLHAEIAGHFNPLQTDNGIRTCFISSDFDVMTIGELINACGYTTESVHGRRVEIHIVEIDQAT